MRPTPNHTPHLPESLLPLVNPQNNLPHLAKNQNLLAALEATVQQIPTQHPLIQADLRDHRTA